ncbi:hypothetical protein YC2023_031759 [Brassica napus]
MKPNTIQGYKHKTQRANQIATILGSKPIILNPESATSLMRVPSSPAKNTCHKAATPLTSPHATFVATIIEHPPENNIIFSRSQRKSATKFHRGGQNRCRSLTIDLRFQENINRLRSIQKINIDSQIESRLGKERLRRRS